MSVKKHIPNSITAMNLLSGVIAVIFTFEGRLDVAFYLMLLAAVFDFCDGLCARLLHAYSDIGKELDSLSDMVSFGVLPALMLHVLMRMSGMDCWLCWVPLAIAVFSALRLAKFNIDERQGSSFLGLATPACAIICGSLACLALKEPGFWLPAFFLQHCCGRDNLLHLAFHGSKFFLARRHVSRHACQGRSHSPANGSGTAAPRHGFRRVEVLYKRLY